MRCRGVTLVELAVALAVLALLLVAGLPSMTTWLQNTRIRNEAESLQNGLQLARMEAVRRNQPVSFWLVALSDVRTMDNSCALSASGASWVVSVNDPSGQCLSAPSVTTAPMIVETHASGDGGTNVVVAATASDGTTAATGVTFNGFGQVVQAGSPMASVGVTSGTTGSGYRNLNVVISNGGSIRMCDPNPDLATSDPRRC